MPSWFRPKNNVNSEASSPPDTPQSHNTVPDTSPIAKPGLQWTRLRIRYNEALPLATDYCLVFTLGVASGAGALLAWRRWGMRLLTAEWVTPKDLAQRRWVRGVVTSVGDADDFRLYHTPGFGWRWPVKFRRVPMRRKDLVNQTIHVRIAGVDAPEGAHWGRPGQPHAEESLAWLRKRILGRTLYCQLIRKDQYGRIVGIPLVPRPFLCLFLGRYTGSSLALEMLRAGMATTYEASGAEYGPWGRGKFLQVEEEARVARRGMWKNGVDIETPSEYKKRYAVALGGTESGSERSDGGDDKRRLLTRLTGMLRK